MNLATRCFSAAAAADLGAARALNTPVRLILTNAIHTSQPRQRMPLSVERTTTLASAQHGTESLGLRYTETCRPHHVLPFVFCLSTFIPALILSAWSAAGDRERAKRGRQPHDKRTSPLSSLDGRINYRINIPVRHTRRVPYAKIQIFAQHTSNLRVESLVLPTTDGLHTMSGAPETAVLSSCTPKRTVTTLVTQSFSSMLMLEASRV